MSDCGFKAKRTFLASVAIISIMAGCAMVPAPTLSTHIGCSDQLGECAEFFKTLDELTEQSHAIESHPFRIEGYPYLRADRFVASFAKEKKNPAAWNDWLNRMQALDLEARTFEIANLAPAAGSGAVAGNRSQEYLERITVCGDLLKKADYPDLMIRLTGMVTAPDDYIVLRRIAGLYPVTRLFISAGVSNWHAQVKQTFSNRPPSDWLVRQYALESLKPLRSAEQIFSVTRRDALGIPDFTPADLQALFRMFAPNWTVQQGDPADRVGTPYWGTDGQLAVDTEKPITYTLLSFTRFENRVLPQLNYFIWFPERPKRHPLDIFGGLLDGLIYRVTLDSDGAPLLYETVHSCGCYYKAYPTKRLEPVAEIPYAEPPLILKAPRLRPAQEVMTISMESRTHYVRHLYPAARREFTAGEHYSLSDYAQLRSLVRPEGGSRSMFGSDSLADGTQRLERFLLWPTGVLSPGAMRQWGRHAVAFAGKRHFDDPFYMEKMFNRR